MGVDLIEQLHAHFLYTASPLTALLQATKDMTDVFTGRL